MQVRTSRSHAGIVAALASAALVIIKIGAAAFTDASSIWASAADSGMDLTASALNALAIRYAERPADADHRWGHGKAEALAAMGQGLVILGTSAAIAWQAVQRAANPQPIAEPLVGIAVMVASLASAWAISRYLTHHAEQQGSLALRADAGHYRTDAVTHTMVILAIVIAWRWQVRWPDTVAALIAVVFLCHTALGILRDAIDELMDKELTDDLRAELAAAIDAVQHAEVSLGSLRSRRAGGNTLVELTLHMPAHWTLDRAELARAEVVSHLERQFSAYHVVARIEPR